MVAQLLRLSALEFAGRFRGGRWPAVAAVISVAWALLLGVLGALFVGLLDGIPDTTLVHRLATVGGALVLLGFLVVPLLRRGDPDDPRRFAVFGLPARSLAAATAVSSVVALPALSLAIVEVGYVVGAATGPAPTAVAVVAALLGFATCLLLARIGAGCGRLLADSPRLRELLGAAGVLVVILAVAAVFATVIATPVGVTAMLAGIADVLAFTPLGAVWSMPGAAVAGEWGLVAVQAGIALGTLAVCWFAWVRVVARMLVTPGHEVATHRGPGLGWFAMLPASPAGVIAARSLSYLGRDPRYWASLVAVPIVPLLLLLPLELAGVPAALLVFIPVPVMCLLLGWSIHNDTANDHTAIWMHVVAGIRGSSDRLGRAVPALVIGLVVIAVGSPLSVVALDQPAAYPAVVGIGFALLFGGLGVASIVSAWLPYPAAKPGDGPFRQPQTTGGAVGLVQGGTFLLTLGASAAPIALTVIGFTTDTTRWYFAALFAGVSTGLFVFVVGVLVGGAVFEHRGPEILQAAVRA